MSTFSIHVVVPVEFSDKADRLAEALGYGPGTFEGREYSANGALPATHRATHLRVTAGFLAMISNAESGTLPAANWSAVGLTGQDVSETLASLRFSIPKPLADANTKADHLAFVTGAGLRAITRTDRPI